ncbi:MAG: 2-succinyl-6-hydroxy-2,4-cyclohexadiene-1-carboxylate synthase [Gemmatimonadota bacterium]
MKRALGHPVLLHGFAGSSAMWGDDVVDGLAGAGLPPVLVDLPGHGGDAGNSDPAAFTLSATLERVASRGDWPADVVGYSMGARLALHFTAANPGRVRRLVLESGSPGLATEAERADRRRADRELADEIVEHGIEAFVDSWEARPIFETRRALGAEIRERQRTLRLRNDPRSLAAALAGFGTGALPSLWESLTGIETPTLLVVGALDRKFVGIAERMAGLMPDARVVVVPGAGHTVHLERPAAWLAAVTAFLRS